MSIIQRILFFLVLPTLAVLFYPPALLASAGTNLLIVVAVFLLIGFFLWRGNPQLLTFSIFIQGMNAVVRLMLFFSHAVSKQQVPDVPFAITSLIGLAISIYLIMRLDRSDVRVAMIRV